MGLRTSAQGLLRLLSATAAKSISEVKPSNKRGAHQNDEIRHICGNINCLSLKTLELPEKLIRLASEINCNIETLTIPENVSDIYSNSFGDLKTLYFKPLMPPAIYGGLEYELKNFDVTIYVPSISWERYIRNEFFKNLGPLPYDF